ncbi:MAG: hypothetical protein J6K37_07555, partial [Lachnospiraceae bacterium]|nr:hypothetical protein [Lachnospiraceae bacterium]
LNVSDEMKLDDDRQNFCEELGAEELCSSSLDTFEELYSSSATDACGMCRDDATHVKICRINVWDFLSDMLYL